MTPRILAAVLWMVGAVVSFIAMMVAVRELADTLSNVEILAFRSIVGLILMAPLVVRFGPAALGTGRLRLHVARNVVHFGGQFCWVAGVTMLPLAAVTAIEFSTPVWVALMAAAFLGEPLARHRVVAVIAGFAGVLVIVRPGLETIDIGVVVVLAASLLYAAANCMVKSLTSTEAPWLILLYMQVIQLPLGLVPALLDWTTPELQDAPWLFLVGATALSAHYCTARAYLLADAAFVSPLDFVRLPLVAVLAWALYGETVDILVFVGAAMIFGGNYYSIRRETRKARP